MSISRIEPFGERSHVAVHDWYHRLKHLFAPDLDWRQTVAVDETKLDIADEEAYVYAAVDVETFEVIHVEVSPGRSRLDALLFLEKVLNYCRGRPVVLTDRVPWYDWPLKHLGCEGKRGAWLDRSLIEA